MTLFYSTTTKERDASQSDNFPRDFCPLEKNATGVIPRVPPKRPPFYFLDNSVKN